MRRHHQKGLSPIAVIVLIALAIGGYLLYSGKISLNQKTGIQTTTLSPFADENAKEKTYANDFYHIKFDIPSDWRVEESTRNDGWPLFKLSSSNQEIIIQNFAPNEDQDYLTIKDDPSAPDMQPDRSNYLSQRAGLKERKVMLGSYEVDRFRYFNKSGSVTDSISLYNIPRQKVVTLYFTVNGDFESNNRAHFKTS